MNLLFAFDRKFIPLFSTCIHSIVKNGGYDHYDAYILHSDLEEEQQAQVCQAAGKQVSCHFIPIEQSIFEGFPTTSRYPLQIYYRLAAPLMLPKELDRILYLDVDLVVINSLKELYDTDFAGNYYAACSHTKEILTKINQLRLGADKDAVYVNSGVLMMNLPLLRENIRLQDIQAYAEKNLHALLLPDQDILTALYGDKVLPLDSLRYNINDKVFFEHNLKLTNEKIDVDWVRNNAVIIHYFGKNKPWKDNYIGVLGQFYQENTK